MGQSAFTDAICKNVTATFDCKSLIKVDVKSFTSFSAATVPAVPVKDGVIDTSTFGTSYDTGGAGRSWSSRPPSPIPSWCPCWATAWST